MKKRILLLLSLLSIFVVGCYSHNDSSVSTISTTSETSSEDVLPSSPVDVMDLPNGVNQYTYSRLYTIDGQEIPLYATKINDSQVWNGLAPNRYDSGLAIVGFHGPFTLRLVCQEAMGDKTVIRPLSSGVNFQVNALDRHEMTFVIKKPGVYVLEPDGEKILAVHLFVRIINDDSEYQNNSNVIYFDKGLHDASNDSRLSSSTLTLKSNQTVYLAFGSIVRARFVASNQQNIKIIGPGIIDGSTFERIAGQSEGNTQFIPFDFSYSSHIEFADFVMSDPAGWCVNWYFVTDSSISRIGIITSRSNGDGISLQSTQRIVVTDSFVRGWDDNLVVKNYPQWNNTSLEGYTDDITFSRCVLWTDLAQSMEIGYETIGQTMKNITFEDITVLHALHKPVISIHNGNNANIENVNYRRITVEDASMGRGDSQANSQLIQIQNIYSSNWSSAHKVTSLGSISGVNVSNLKVLKGNSLLAIAISGIIDPRSQYPDDPHYVDDVHLIDCDFYGEIIDENYLGINVGLYVRGFSISKTSQEVTGATSLPNFVL